MLKTASLLAIMLATLASTAGAQELRVPSSNAEVKLSFAPIVARSAPAVVNVYALKTRRVSNPMLEDPFFRRFFGGQGGAPEGQERMQRSLGSGVIVEASGIIVTNFHVIEGADEVRVALNDKREYPADILLRDQRTDLAVLRIRRDGDETFATLPLGNSDQLAVGDIVLAIGDPFGVGQTVTQGIISALARTQVGVSDYQFFIQTDAAINPGNSGGALVDMSGRLVGINTAIYSRSGGSHGIGFAIPVNMVSTVLEQAKAGGSSVKRPWLGAQLQQVTPDIADGLGLERPMGALVQQVMPGSPADRAGLQSGDLIMAVEGQGVEDPPALHYRIATRPLGSKAALRVQRGNKQVSLVLVLEAAPEIPPRNEVLIQSRSPFAGARVVNLSPAVAEELRLDVDASGVVIAAVEPGSPAARAGFRPADIIVDVNGQKVANTAEMQRITSTPLRGWRIAVDRGGRLINALLPG
ncbi:DegQ family serine endoprotease [Xanthobacter sp. TB0136]|uniref:DegQ family serine endoprotease n=1 Tax=Xanthobacter sp. TB0136 TaxID=3459177 RepID=UPI00403A1693